MVYLSKSTMSLLVVLLSNTATANPIVASDIIDSARDTFSSLKVQLSLFQCTYNVAWEKRFELHAWDKTGKLSMTVGATSPDSEGIATFMLSEGADVQAQRFGVNTQFKLHTIHTENQKLDKEVNMQISGTDEVGKLVADPSTPQTQKLIASLPFIRFEPPGKNQSSVYQFPEHELATVLVLRIGEVEPFERCTSASGYGTTHYIKRISDKTASGHTCTPVTLGIVGEMVMEVYAALKLEIKI
jgi:hypothetical protein